MKTYSWVLVLGVLASVSVWAEDKEDGDSKKKPEVSVATEVNSTHSTKGGKVMTGVQAGVKSKPLVAVLDVVAGQQTLKVSGSAEVYPIRLVKRVVGEDAQTGTKTVTIEIVPLTAKGQLALDTVKHAVSNASIEVTPEFAVAFKDLNDSALEKGGLFKAHIKASVGPSAGGVLDTKNGNGKLVGAKASLSLGFSVVVYPRKAGMIEGTVAGSVTPDFLSGEGSEKTGLSVAGKLGYKQNLFEHRPGEDPRNRPNWFINAQMAANKGGVVPKGTDATGGSSSSLLGVVAGVAF
jgi:hypothetical protein